MPSKYQEHADRFNAGELEPSFDHSDIVPGEYLAEIVKIARVGGKFPRIDVSYRIHVFDLIVHQAFFVGSPLGKTVKEKTENNDRAVAKYFTFLKRLGIKEMKGEFITTPPPKIIGSSVMIEVFCEGKMRNAKFKKLEGAAKKKRGK